MYFGLIIMFNTIFNIKSKKMRNSFLSLTVCTFLTLGITNATYAESVPVDLDSSKIDPTIDKGGPHKSPVLVPEVSLDDHTLYFFTPCDGCVLNIVDGSGALVYTLVIPTGTTSLELPATLIGDYELQIIRGNYCFWGEIVL